MYQEFIKALAEATQRAHDLMGLDSAVRLMRRLEVISSAEAIDIRRDTAEASAKFHNSPLYLAWKKTL